MKKICPHCNEEIEYEKYQQFGAHITNCKLNPNREEIRRKIYENNRVDRFDYELNCLFCDKEYKLNLTESEFKTNRYKKCCSDVCAKKVSSSFIDYNKTKKSKCIECGCDIIINIIASEKKCKCDICGNFKSNENLRYTKAKNGKIKNKSANNNKKIICNICGQEKCHDYLICKTWQSGRSKIFIKFGFNINKLGSLDFYDEYNRIIELLKEEYKNNSLIEIGEKYMVNYQTIHTVFKSIGIKLRNNSESVLLAFKKGRLFLQDINIYPYKSGYHTTWRGDIFWLRSSYELDYCKKLDDEKIRYEVEKIRIQYFDTKDNVERTAVPDFYLIDTNELVEIKSSWTYNEQNMKDKIKAYKENGYEFKLILDKKEIKL